jgi:hypothetical protein
MPLAVVFTAQAAIAVVLLLVGLPWAKSFGTPIGLLAADLLIIGMRGSTLRGVLARLVSQTHNASLPGLA